MTKTPIEKRQLILRLRTVRMAYLIKIIFMAGWCIILSGACKSSSSINENIAEVNKDVFIPDLDNRKDNYEDTTENIVENVTDPEDYDYDDTSATIDENHEEEDDSNDAFKDVEEEQVCAIQQSNEPQEKKLPGALVIGTKKGGTRALLEFLNIHSKIKRAKNEMHFYDKHYSRGLDWYIEKMPAVTADQVQSCNEDLRFLTADEPFWIYSVN